jgi:hypothetical protein
MMKNVVDALFVFAFALAFTLFVNFIRKEATINHLRAVANWKYLAVAAVSVLLLIMLGYAATAHADDGQLNTVIFHQLSLGQSPGQI